MHVVQHVQCIDMHAHDYNIVMLCMLQYACNVVGSTLVHGMPFGATLSYLIN